MCLELIQMIQPSSIDQANDAAFQTMSVNPESLTVDDVEEKKRKQEKRREDGEKIWKKKKATQKPWKDLGVVMDTTHKLTGNKQTRPLHINR